MIRLFRSFSWGALPPLLVFAVAWWTWAAWAMGPPDSGTGVPLVWVALNAIGVVLIGFLAAAVLQVHRLANAGTLPGFLAVLLGSGAAAWSGPGAAALAALAVVGAAHQLYGAYRQQGASLPVYNTGLFLGLAWLLSAPFVWMVGWALVTLPQLRSPRGKDFLGLLLGALTLPLLWGMWAYAFGDLPAALSRLTRGIAHVPTGADLRHGFPVLAILGAATGLAVLAYGSLTTRRTIQEQRAHRLYYTMLAFGWATVLLAGPPAGDPEVAFSPAPLLLPLSVLLGVYLLELPRKPADALLVAATLATLGARAYAALAT